MKLQMYMPQILSHICLIHLYATAKSRQQFSLKIILPPPLSRAGSATVLKVSKQHTKYYK